MVKFDSYDDVNLPFLNPENPTSILLRENIIDGDQDDDCQTDEDVVKDAKKSQIKDLKKAVSTYLES